MNSPASGDQLRVIIVDDVADNADTLSVALGLHGLETRTANDGDEAVLIMDGFQPHCVLFDICMPGMDGLDLARRLRSTSGDDVILIAMTGLDADDIRVADTFNLVDHYFQKPFELDALLRIFKPIHI
ncbi:MAG: response regulator [Pseudomonadota bacterium]